MSIHDEAAAAAAHAEGQTLHNTKQAARDVARQITDAAVRQVEPEAPASHKLDTDHGIPNYQAPPGSSRETAEKYAAMPKEQPTEGAEAAEVVEEATQILEDAGIEVTPELLDQLADRGIELGIDPASVPEPLKPAYSALAAAADSIANKLAERDSAYKQLEMERAALSDQFNNSPEKVLLAMAMARPEAFATAAEVINKMRHDEEYANMVQRELESEARYAEAQRLTQLNEYNQRRAAALKLTAETKRVSRRLGLDFDAADAYIGSAITANGGRPIPLEQIETLLTTLAGKKRAPVRKPLVVTPQVQRAASTAPNLPAEGDAGAGDQGNVGRIVSRGRQSKLRNVIGSAIRKTYGGSER